MERTIKGVNDIDKHNKSLISKSNTLFISCVPKINGTLIDNVEDLNLAMLMYNFVKYSKTYERHLVLYGIITKIFQLIL